MKREIGLALSAATLALTLTFAANGAGRTGEFTTSFEIVAPYARLGMLGQRLLHSVMYEDLAARIKRHDVDPNAYTVDPRDEQWLVYVPEPAAANSSYGLLVWIPEDDNPEDILARLKPALDATGTAAVLPVDAGSGENPVARRAAMGLHGLNWFVKNYPLNPKRLSIGGNASGATVATNLMHGYADVFHQAILLNPEAVPGSDEIPIPSLQLVTLLRQQGNIHLVYDGDSAAEKAREVAARYAQLCVPGVSQVEAKTTLAAAVHASLVESKLHGMRQADQGCLAKLDSILAERLTVVDALLKSGNGRKALAELGDLYIEYGGLINTRVNDRVEIIRADYKELLNDFGDFIQQSGNRQLPPPPVTPPPVFGPGN